MTAPRTYTVELSEAEMFRLRLALDLGCREMIRRLSFPNRPSKSGDEEELELMRALYARLAEVMRRPSAA